MKFYERHPNVFIFAFAFISNSRFLDYSDLIMYLSNAGYLIIIIIPRMLQSVVTNNVDSSLFQL